MTINWEGEIEGIETDVQRMIRLALKKSAAFKQVIVVAEEAEGESGTIIRLFSSDMTTNEQIGILHRGMKLATEGNELDDVGRRKGHPEDYDE